MTSKKLTESLKNTVRSAKDALEFVRSTVQLPSSEERKRITNEKILSGLQKVGLATNEEVESLKAKIAKLESELASLAQKESKAKKTTKSAPAADAV